jgi:hypothetical protein
MQKKVIISGLVGAIVLLIWTFVVNGILGFNVRFNMKQVPNEREVYAMLKATISEPGRYLCNPALTPDGRYPESEPVFGIYYSGVGHEAAGVGMIFGLFEFLITPLLGAWMLSRTSDLYRSRSLNRVMFFIAIGLLLAITGDLHSFGIGGSPLNLALLFTARTLVTWAILGVVIAPFMRPKNHVISTK